MALVVEVKPEDFPGDYKTNPLAGIDFQRQWESAAFVAGGSTYAAPAQRIGDFLAGRPSTALGSVDPSYQPGVHMTDLTACVPAYVSAALREAIPAFDPATQAAPTASTTSISASSKRKIFVRFI